MNERTIIVSNIQNVVASGTAKIILDPAYMYLDIILTVNFVASNISMSRLRINGGSPIQEITGAHRDLVNQFMGLRAVATSNMLHFPQRMFRLLDRNEELEYGLNCGSPDANGKSIYDVVMELDLAAAVAPTISCKAIVTDKIAGGPGSVHLIKRQLYNFSGAQTLANLTEQPANKVFSFVHGLAFIPSANNVTATVLNYAGAPVENRLSADNTEILDTYGKRTPQSGMFYLDSTEEGYASRPWDISVVGTQWNPQVTVDGAMALSVYQVGFHPFSAL